MKRVSLYAIVAILLINLMGCGDRTHDRENDVVKVTHADVISIVMTIDYVRTFSTEGTFLTHSYKTTFKFDASVTVPTITHTEMRGVVVNMAVIVFKDKSQYDSYVKVAAE